MKLNILLIISMLFLVSFNVFSKADHGGLVGGGDVKVKQIVKCRVENGDHESSTLEIVKEIDWDGNFIENSSFVIILRNVSCRGVHRFGSEEHLISALSNFEIYNSRRHAVGNIELTENDNDDSSIFTGNLSLKDKDKDSENDFELTNCHWHNL